MKHRFSICIEESTILEIRERLRGHTFRNKSHFFEVAAKELLQREANNNA